DKAVEALGVGLSAQADKHVGSRQPTVLLSLGTYIASMTAGDAEAMHQAAGGPHTWVNSASVPGDILYESKGIRRGMWTVSWLRSLVSSAPSGDRDEGATQAWLEQGAREVSPGSEGLFVVPDFLAGPDGPDRRGSILGLAGQHGPHHLHRAVLEGIVLTMRVHAAAMIDALNLDSPRIVVSGGGAQSDLMMQIVADSWGVTATRAGMPDAAGLGSAICASVGAGVHRDFPAAIAAMVRPGREFAPDPSAVAAYRDVADVFDSLTGFTDPMYRYIRAAQR
ncbi:MAG: FGGY-family carbohydrate kinase, partial [Ornithinimicrobium sp.]